MIAVSDLTESHVAMGRITDALFCSDLETDSLPTRRQLADAVRGALKTHRNWNGCTRAVAEAFTRNPNAADKREAWCHKLAESALSSADIRLDLDDLP